MFHAPVVGLVVFDAATLSQRAWNGSGWALLAPRIVEASATYDPPSLAAGEGVTTTVAVTDAALCDFVRASFSLDRQGVMLSAWVSATNMVSVRSQNVTTSAVDLGSGTLRVRVEKASDGRKGCSASCCTPSAITRHAGSSASPMTTGLVGSGQVRRHPHHHNRSAPRAASPAVPAFSGPGPHRRGA